MSTIHVRHLKAKLNDIYKDVIDTSDATNENDKENLFLTRAFAAYTLQILAQATVENAANSIIDGRDDNGIDAIYFDRIAKTLWIVQTKWIKKGMGEPETGDTNKFKTGIINLIDLELERFNNKTRAMHQEIEDALNDYEVKIKIVLAYTGSDTFSSHNQRIVSDLLKEINDSSEIATFIRFSLNQAHKSLIGVLEGQPITSELSIENWGKVEEPYKAIYGSINGTFFAQLWAQYRSKLFSDNIREFLGKSDVNEDIKNTILNEPNNFFYYNNGVTILCQSFIKKPLVVSRNTGQFEITDLRIVNGAQTVGSIGAAYEQDDKSVENINVFTKIIALDACPIDFGFNVTQKTNTQNKIEKRDFVSLDTQHTRLKTELALDGITYQIKRSEDILPKEDSCTVEELIVAVACSLKNVNTSILAKREVGKLWEQINASPYTDIINATLSACKSWRCILVMRVVADMIKTESKTMTGREKACIIHSNRFVLYRVLNTIPKQSLLDEKFDFVSFVNNELHEIIKTIQEKTYKKVEELYPESLIHQIFRNQTKVRDVNEKWD